MSVLREEQTAMMSVLREEQTAMMSVLREEQTAMMSVLREERSLPLENSPKFRAVRNVRARRWWALLAAAAVLGGCAQGAAVMPTPGVTLAPPSPAGMQELPPEPVR